MKQFIHHDIEYFPITEKRSLPRINICHVYADNTAEINVKINPIGIHSDPHG